MVNDLKNNVNISTQNHSFYIKLGRGEIVEGVTEIYGIFNVPTIFLTSLDCTWTAKFKHLSDLQCGPCKKGINTDTSSKYKKNTRCMEAYNLKNKNVKNR